MGVSGILKRHATIISREGQEGQIGGG